MAFRKLNRRAQINHETGLGTNTSLSGGRFFAKDGRANIEVRGLHFWQRLNLFHTMLSMKRWKFLAYIMLFFIGINLIFAGIYLLIGLEHLSGLVANTMGEQFGEAFFFSAQTFTTVGYGRINPVGFLTSFVASFEALTGLMSFALVTGMIYGRFSRPRSFIRFSNNALFTPFKDGVALMFRMAPYTKNYLVNVEVKVTIAMKVQEDGVIKNQFFNMPLDIAKASTMTTNWTLVHPINEESPLYQLSKLDLEAAETELLIFVQGFDESFSNTVISKASYRFEEFVYGARFVPMYHPNEAGTGTVLELDKLDHFAPAELSIQY